LLQLLKKSTCGADANDRQSRITCEDVITMPYLLYCFFVSSVDLTCFKKLGVETADGQISVRQELWINRMHSLMPAFTQAACTWAGYGKNGTSALALTLYWDGETHPTVFSIPHLAAQDIVERVHCLCLFHN
jgi:hypothetical protein